MKKVEVVGEIYAAFGRGDVPAILDRLHPEVEWEYGGTDDVPWLQPRRGRAGAGQFFESLRAIEIHKFEPKALLEGEGVVVALLDLEATVKATGQRVVEEDEVHIWRFDSGGLVTRFRHRADTAQHAHALRGGGPTALS
jgi:uncharacterized protein